MILGYGEKEKALCLLVDERHTDDIINVSRLPSGRPGRLVGLRGLELN